MTVSTAQLQMQDSSVGPAPAFGRDASGLDLPGGGSLSRNTSLGLPTFSQQALDNFGTVALGSELGVRSGFSSRSTDHIALFSASLWNGSTDNSQILPSLSSFSRDQANIPGMEPFGALSSLASRSEDQAALMPFGGPMPAASTASLGNNSVDVMVLGLAPHQQQQFASSGSSEVHAAANTLQKMAPAAAHLPVPTKQEPARSRATEERNAGRKRKRTSPVAQQPVHSSRGAHVKNRPEMQRQARDGQQHWAKMVKQKREEWGQMAATPHEVAFKAQVDMCVRRNIKSQKECLLRFLHISTSTKLVKPVTPFEPLLDADEDPTSFLGWKGFTVAENNGGAFKRGVEAMFQEDHPKQNTVQNLFRRAGLVPDDWEQAWEGKVPFRFTSPAPTERKKT